MSLVLMARAEAGQASEVDLADADWTLVARIEAALNRQCLIATSTTKVAELSGGQRTRALLAALVFAEPDIILLDEPTNNLDQDGRGAVIDLLGAWRGAAVVVSHDRELLEYVDAIVELTSLGATTYGGNWSHYHAQKVVELTAAEHDLATAERQIALVKRQRQQVAERKQRRDRAGRAKRARGDQPRMALGSLKNRSENTGGADTRTTQRLQDSAQRDASKARERIETLKPVSVGVGSTELPNGKLVLRIDNLIGGYDAEPRVIDCLSFAMTGPERVAIVGPNGSGKTTLLKLMTGKLNPQSGNVWILPDFAMLDQHVGLLDPLASVRDNFHRLNPHTHETECRNALARLSFRADTALQRVSTLSGGQKLRAALACVLGSARPPALLILDEPTNHLDIEATEAVENGLRDYDGALLVISHDSYFLDAIGITRRVEL